jgi:hypothetical protein
MRLASRRIVESLRRVSSLEQGSVCRVWRRAVERAVSCFLAEGSLAFRVIVNFLVNIFFILFHANRSMS